MSKRGFALSEVMVGVVLVAGLSLLVSQMGKQTNQVSQKGATSTAMSVLSNEVGPIRKDLARWMSVLRTASATTDIAKAIPASGAADQSGVAGVVTDSVIKQKSGARAVHSVPLVNVTPTGGQPGTKIAGTESVPVYYDSLGSPCPGGRTDKRCKFQAVGYMIRENSSGDPGNVKFVFKVSQNETVAHELGDQKIAPFYADIDLGLSWKDSADKTKCVDQIEGRSPSGATICYEKPICDVAQKEAFAGWDSNGRRICQTGPVDEINGKSCPAGQVLTGIDSDSKLICSTPENTSSWQWSACSKACDGGTQTATCVAAMPSFAVTQNGCTGASTRACNTQSCNTCEAPIWQQAAQTGYYDANPKNQNCASVKDNPASVPVARLCAYGPGATLRWNNQLIPIPCGAGVLVNAFPAMPGWGGHICDGPFNPWMPANPGMSSCAVLAPAQRITVVVAPAAANNPPR